MKSGVHSRINIQGNGSANLGHRSYLFLLHKYLFSFSPGQIYCIFCIIISYNLYDLDLNSSDDVTLENMREQAQSYRKQNQVRRKQCCFAGPFFRSQSAWGFGSGSRCNSGSQILNF